MCQARILARVASSLRHPATRTRAQAILGPLLLIGVVAGASCLRIRTETPASADPLSDSLRASKADSTCPVQSGVRFQLQISTPRFATYGERPVLASIGPDSASQSISPEYLMATRFGLSGLPNRGVYPTRSSGSLPITISVVDTLHRGRQLASVRMQVPLKPEWLWFVSIRIQPDRTNSGYEFFNPPTEYRAVSLTNGDSLYVYVVGQSRAGPPMIH